MLLQAGADPNLTDGRDMTALMHAGALVSQEGASGKRHEPEEKREQGRVK